MLEVSEVFLAICQKSKEKKDRRVVVVAAYSDTSKLYASSKRTGTC